MALTIKLGCGNDGAGYHHLSIQALDPKSQEFEVELLDHESVEHEQLMAFMTGQKSICLKAYEMLSLGLEKVFEYEDLTKKILDAIEHDGIEALGMSRETFAELVIDYVEFLIPKTGFYTGQIEWYNLTGDSGAVDADDFLKLIDTMLPWFRKTRAFKRRVHNMVLLAYLQETEGAGQLNFFHRLVEMTKKRLIHVAFIRDEIMDEGSGHTTKKIVIGAYIGRTIVDEWEVVVDGWICDFDMWEWCTQVDKDQSRSPSDATEEFMRTAGYGTNYDDSTGRDRFVEIEELVKPHIPEMPSEIKDYWRKTKGPYVIHHDPYAIFGRFKTFEEAYLYYDAHTDASDFVLRQPYAGMCGIFLRLIRIINVPNEPEEDSPEDKATMAGREADWVDRDYDYDEHPEEIWEILYQQEI